jgi:type I restriction enzyme S subunit
MNREGGGNVGKVNMREQVKIMVERDASQTEVDALKHPQAETILEMDAIVPAILDKAFNGKL